MTELTTNMTYSRPKHYDEASMTRQDLIEL
jgi:hypothetical protein